MSWIDDILNKHKADDGSELMRLLNNQRQTIYGILDAFVNMGLDIELSHAYGLDAIYKTFGKNSEYTFALFAEEWLVDHMPDDDDELEVR